VLGISSRAAEELHVPACEADGVPVLRRLSGGAAVLLGPGAVCFGAFLPHEAFPDAATIGGAYRTVVSALARAFASVGVQTGFELPCDVTVGARKLVGMAQARRRSASLVHGVVPVTLSVGEVERYLSHPPEEPAYRAGRSHGDFMTTLADEAPSVTVEDLVAALGRGFREARLPPLEAEAEERERASELLKERYADRAWIFRR
jgi:lipoate-protein ligase A